MELPLFPLSTVLCPGIAMPLHVFEDRYRAMVGHCLETGSPFGIVQIRSGREVGAGTVSFNGIGTIAEIRDAGRDEDGRYDLLVVGTRRFEIRRILTNGQPYLVADVQLLDEEIGDAVVAQRLALTATRRFVAYLELLQPRFGETAEEIDVRVEIDADDDDGDADEPESGSFGGDLPDDGPSSGSPPDDAGGPDKASAGRRRRVTIPDDPTVLSYLLAGILQIEAPRRQALLETVTTEARLGELLALIDRETFLLERRLRFFRPDSGITGARRS